MNPTAFADTVMAVVIAGLGSLVLTRAVLDHLRRRQFFDHPNERSSHKRPTPRGGGLGIIPAILAAWMWAAASPGTLAAWAWVAVGGTLVLMVASWADDRHSLPAAPRFLAHAGVIAGALVMLPDQAMVFQGWLPLWADRLLAGIGWLWFVNLYNFMDGIDGITGVETASLGGGIAVVAGIAGLSGAIPFAIACAVAGLAFLVWNWHPAKVFLGDVGSIPLGFLLGGLLVQLAAAGALAAALILPAYYLADATITLLRRAAKGETVWQAHRQHFYQRAVHGGKRHDQVVLAVLAADLLLIAAASVAASGRVVEGALAALAIVATLLAVMTRWARGRGA